MTLGAIAHLLPIPEGTSTETILSNEFMILIYLSIGERGAPLIPEPSKQSTRRSVLSLYSSNSEMFFATNPNSKNFFFAITEVGVDSWKMVTSNPFPSKMDEATNPSPPLFPLPQTKDILVLSLKF